MLTHIGNNFSPRFASTTLAYRGNSFPARRRARRETADSNPTSLPISHAAGRPISRGLENLAKRIPNRTRRRPDS